MDSGSHSCSPRSPNAKELYRAGSGYDDIEDAILDIARLFWKTFAEPHTQAWLFALHEAEMKFAHPQGAQIGLEVLATVQAMRRSRVSMFNFNNPMCANCSVIISEHERQFMEVFRSLRAGRLGSAQTHAMLLCEGNDATDFIERMIALLRSCVPDAPCFVAPHSSEMA